MRVRVLWDHRITEVTNGLRRSRTLHTSRLMVFLLSIHFSFSVLSDLEKSGETTSTRYQHDKVSSQLYSFQIIILISSLNSSCHVFVNNLDWSANETLEHWRVESNNLLVYRAQVFLSVMGRVEKGEKTQVLALGHDYKRTKWMTKIKCEGRKCSHSLEFRSRIQLDSGQHASHDASGADPPASCSSADSSDESESGSPSLLSPCRVQRPTLTELFKVLWLPPEGRRRCLFVLVASLTPHATDTILNFWLCANLFWPSHNCPPVQVIFWVSFHSHFFAYYDHFASLSDELSDELSDSFPNFRIRFSFLSSMVKECKKDVVLI